MPRTNQTSHNIQAHNLWRNLASFFHTNLSRFKRSKPFKRLKTVLGGKRSRFIHARRVHRHVYLDELYMQSVAPGSVEVVKMAAPETKKLNIINETETKDYCYNSCPVSSGLNSEGALWGMEEVDMRAEMFINKFKEEMRLQRQRSFKEYQEMLARSV